MPGGGLRARAALGAWGQRAPRPSARATARVRAGPAPRAAVPAPSCTRAALDTRKRRRRRAGRPCAKAATSDRDSPDRPQAPGGQNPPSVAPRPSDASPWLRRAARTALPGRRRPPAAWRWEPGAGSPTRRGGGARARAGGGRSPRDAGPGDTVGAGGPRASRHTGARERGACAVLFAVGEPSGPPGRVLSCPVAASLGAERHARPLCLPQDRRGQRKGRQRLASPGDLVIPYQPPEDVSSVLTMNAVADSGSEGL